MKLQYNNKKWNYIRQRSRGYAAIAMVALLGMTALLGLLSVFRQGMRSHESQIRNQIKIDYRQKEDALLRALVAEVPNKAIGAMMPNSAGNAVNFSWDTIFTTAIAEANAEGALDTAVVNSFGINGIISANTANTATLLPANFVSIIAGDGTLVGPGCTYNAGLLSSSISAKLPPPLDYAGNTGDDKLGPIISTGKTYPAGTVGLGAKVTSWPIYNMVPYPNIRFGFSTQGQYFIAKRNWWAFSLTFGQGVSLTNNTGTPSSALTTVTKNYVLSIYEMPSQLAISAGSILNLGRYADGSNWANTIVDGGVFGTEVNAGGVALIGNAKISARRSLTGNATVGGIPVAAGFDALGTREVRQAATGTDYYGASLVGNSGKVAVLPLSQGDQFLQMEGSIPGGTSLSPTGWFEYAMGARQCAMQIEIREVEGGGAGNLNRNKPVWVRFHYLAGGVSTFQDFKESDGTWDNQDRDINPTALDIPFYCENLGLVVGTGPGTGFPALYKYPALAIKINEEIPPTPRFANFLAAIGADGLDVNDSLAVWSNTTQAGVNAPIIPSGEHDLGVVLRGGSDMRGFTNGFSLVTDHRVYLPEDLNQENIPAPGGSGLPGGYVLYPAVSIFAAEKRFGINPGGVSSVTVDGQLTSLQEDDGTVVNPLDLETGGGLGLAVGTGITSANLSQLLAPCQLPPVNKMTWLVVIEEIQ